jgi:hypothetical protein
VIQTPNSPNGSVQGGIQVTITSDVIETAVGTLPPNVPQQRVVLDVWARLQSGRWVLSKLNVTVILRSGGVAKSPLETSSLGVAARPNPMQSTISIEWTAPEAGPARLAIYDASGREVRELFSGSTGTGLQQYQWDGRDAHGTSMPSGVYYYRLLAGETMVTENIYLIR